MTAEHQRIEAADVHAFLQDDAGAEKADARGDIGQNPGRPLGAHQPHAEIDEGGGAERDQRIGAQAGVTLAILPLGPDQRPEHERDEERDERV